METAPDFRARMIAKRTAVNPDFPALLKEAPAMNFLNRCAHCQHWGRDPSEHDPNWGECRLASTTYRGPDHSPTLAKAIGDGDHGALMTYHDFGCVQWEPRPMGSTHANPGT